MDGFAGVAPIGFTDTGEPVVDHLPHDMVKDQAGRPYMYRYYLRHGPKGDVRFHHIVASDDARALHDHPWDFASLMLTGTYLEHTYHGTERYTAPAFITRAAGMAHRLELDQGDVWTYVVTGRICRRWGFHTQGGWVPWAAYLAGGGVSAAGGGIDRLGE